MFVSENVPHCLPARKMLLLRLREKEKSRTDHSPVLSWDLTQLHLMVAEVDLAKVHPPENATWGWEEFSSPKCLRDGLDAEFQKNIADHNTTEIASGALHVVHA